MGCEKLFEALDPNFTKKSYYEYPIFTLFGTLERFWLVSGYLDCFGRRIFSVFLCKCFLKLVNNSKTESKK
jgi:hypothetical protein